MTLFIDNDDGYKNVMKLLKEFVSNLRGQGDLKNFSNQFLWVEFIAFCYKVLTTVLIRWSGMILIYLLVNVFEPFVFGQTLYIRSFYFTPFGQMAFSLFGQSASVFFTFILSL